MKKATFENFQARLAEYVDSSLKQPVLIVRDGEPVAMLVGLAPKGKRTRVKLRDVLKQAWMEYDAKGGVPHDQFWQEVAKETGLSKKNAK